MVKAKDGRNEFKDTEIGKIPKEWEVVRLEKIISSYQSGIWGDDPVPSEKSYPVIRSTEITYDGKIDLSTVAFRKIPEEQVNKYSLQDGDILLVASSGSSHLIGRAALFKQPGDNKTYLFSNFMVRIRPKNVDSSFLYYFLNSSRYYRFLRCLQQTSTGLRNLPKKEFIRFQLPLPPLPEQRRIAEILSTVDQAIQKVDEAIARTERLKRGLMQRLLTRGIGHREFKDTEIGRIPKEWEVVRLGEISLDFIGGGTPSTSNPEYWNGDIPWMTSAHINGRLITTGQRYITEKGLKESAANLVPKENILVATRVGIGKVAINLIDIAISQDLTGVVIKKDRALPDFIYWALVKNESKLKSLAQGSTIKGVLREDLAKVLIPLPPLPEQRKIAEILSTVDKKLELERRRKEKLERIKRGLMNDLLTGKRRVKYENTSTS